jgi:tetratricopeptide (TPR) repeat protein
LATTLGILGEHHVAYELFARLIKLEVSGEPSLYHYAAVAAWNSGKYERARAYWKKAEALDPDSEVATFYLENMDRWRKLDKVPTVHYHYQLPFEEQLLRMEPMLPTREWLTLLKSNPLLRSSFFWALERGDRETKWQVLKILSWIADEEVKGLLRQLIEQEGDADLKEVAALLLNQMEQADQVTKEKGERKASGLSRNEKWEQVLSCCMEKLEQDLAHLKRPIERLWTELVTQHSEQFSHVRKVEGWAAALEYLAAKYHGFRLTQKEVAEKYQVSLSTVSRHAKMLEPAAKRCFS